jgi:hypothetical protein
LDGVAAGNGTARLAARFRPAMQTPIDDKAARRFADILGVAVAKQWHALGQDAQRLIFEAAVESCGRSDDVEFREALAVFLHDRHPRTEPEAPR